MQYNEKDGENYESGRDFVGCDGRIGKQYTDGWERWVCFVLGVWAVTRLAIRRRFLLAVVVVMRRRGQGCMIFVSLAVVRGKYRSITSVFGR